MLCLLLDTHLLASSCLAKSGCGTNKMSKWNYFGIIGFMPYFILDPCPF